MKYFTLIDKFFREFQLSLADINWSNDGAARLIKIGKKS